MKRIVYLQMTVLLTAFSCLAHTWMTQWTPDGWTSCLGPEIAKGHVPDGSPVDGAAFLLESQARENSDEYLKVLRAQIIGDAMGESSEERGQLDLDGFWQIVAMTEKRRIAAEVEASRVTKVRQPSKIEIKEDQKKIKISKEGVIEIPAVAGSIDEDSESVLVMNSASGGVQIHVARMGDGPATASLEYAVEAKSGGEYELGAELVTIHNGVTIELAVNGAEDAQIISIPYTVGEWSNAKLLDVRLEKGVNKLLFRGVSKSHGVSIKRLVLTPAK